MGNLLVTSSPRGELSHSSRFAKEIAQGLGGNLTIRELWRTPPEPIGPEFIGAIFTPEADRTPEQRAALAPSNASIEEVVAADTIVVAAGMINFGMPASLKTWVDQITRSGVTFSYGESGPVGLLTGKRLILVLAAGGVYSSGPMAPMNHLESALRTNLGFIGLTDVETLWIEGTAFGEDATERALSNAGERTRELVGAR